MNDFPANLLQVYLDRFSNRFDVYAEQWIDDTKYAYKPVYKPMTVELIAEHLSGSKTIGFYCLSKESTSNWLCFDSDSDDGNLDKLNNLFCAHRWRTILEGRRTGRAGHLWLFFDQSIPATILRQFGKLFQKAASVAEGCLELFPKQDKLDKLGNLVRGPLGIHLKPGANGCRGWFEVPPQDIQAQLEWFASQKPNQAQHLIQFTNELAARQTVMHHVAVSPKRKFTRGGCVNFIEYARANNFVLKGNNFVGPCPSCKSVGRDSDDNHLSIHAIEGWAHCWRGCSFDEVRNNIRVTGK